MNKAEKLNCIIEKRFLGHQEVISKTHEAVKEQIFAVTLTIVSSLKKGGTLYWCGNGGSAADSQHLAAELIGRFSKNRRALRSIALTTDSSVLTCVANDFDFDQIFSRQLEGLACESDVLVGLSTSGNSSNILKVFQKAKSMGVTTIGLLGGSGGTALNVVDHALVIPSRCTSHIQEAHILIGHILCELIEKELCLD